MICSRLGSYHPFAAYISRVVCPCRVQAAGKQCGGTVFVGSAERQAAAAAVRVVINRSHTVTPSTGSSERLCDTCQHGVRPYGRVIAYVSMGSGPADSIGRAAADRWLLILLGITGVAIVTAETTRTEARRLSLVRTLVGAATFCSLVAIYQFITHTDPDLWIRPYLLGLTDNGGDSDSKTVKLT